MAGLNIAESAAQHEKSAARRAELDARDREHGGSVSIADIEEERAKREVLRDWRAYRPDVKRSEVDDARRGIVRADPRRVSVQRLWIDCGAACRRWIVGAKERRATVRNDALLALLKWESHGALNDPDRAPFIHLGGEGGCPLRRDWLEPTNSPRGYRDKLTARAWSALRAAVKQAASAEPINPPDVPTDPVDIARQIEDSQRESGEPIRLPDRAAPDVIARYLDLPLQGAQAILADAFPHASQRELAREWNLSERGIRTALSRGRAIVRERFTFPELLAALRDAETRYSADIAIDAVLALLRYRDGTAQRCEAESACLEWRGQTGELSPQRRALLVAALSAARRERAREPESAHWEPELVALSVARMMRAETRRAALSASLGARGAGLRGERASASTELLARLRAPQSTSAPDIDPRLAAAQRGAVLKARSEHAIAQWQALKASWAETAR